MSSGQPNAYQYQGLSGANQGWSSLLGSLGGAFNSFQNNPYGGQAQAGAGTVASQGPGIGQGQISSGQNLQGQAGAGFPYAQQLLQTAFDPQKGLYGRAEQQTTDQTNAGLASSGLLGSPFGAGIQAQNNQNFNIDWKNNTLNREATGLQGFGSYLGQAGNAYGQGAGLESQGLGTIAGSTALPYSTYASQIKDLFGLGGQLGQQDQGFLGTGLGFQNSASGIASQNASFEQKLGQGIGGLLGMLGGGGFGDIGSFLSSLGGGGGGAGISGLANDSLAFI